MYGYAARMLEHYVREVGLMSLEEAVRRMSGLPAAMAGLRTRGTLTAGKVADVVVFDHDAVCDRSRPEDPARYASGMDLVMVGGRPVVLGGVPTTARPGGAARRGC
jgi:N-acyl-D-aspartate/D-glutamate deacylase